MSSNSSDNGPQDTERSAKRARLLEHLQQDDDMSEIHWHSLYQSLDFSRMQIRVLRLMPSRSLQTDPEGNLSAIALSEADFAAISYVWGDTRKERCMTLNGHRVPIGANAYTALRYIRDTSQETNVWIDAICIDQQNLQERSEQVSLMSQIFNKARTVWLWTGRHTKHSKNFVQVMRKLRMMHDPSQGELDLDSEDSRFLSGMDVAKWRSIGKFMSNSFWYRVWTMQEIIISAARGSAVLLFGRCHMQYDIFMKGIQAFIKAGTLLILQDRYMFLVRPMQTFSRQFFIKDDFERDQVKPSDFLYQTNYLVATDQRDYVYGLLGIFPSLTNIRPDYTKSFAAVFEEATLAIIHKTRSLNCLIYCWRTKRHEDDLPSWVLDWRPTSGSIARLSGAMDSSLYMACYGYQPCIDRRPEGLLVNGCEFMRIRNLHAFQFDVNAGLHTFKELARIKSTLQASFCSQRVGGEMLFEEAFGRMIVLDAYVHEDESKAGSSRIDWNKDLRFLPPWLELDLAEMLECIKQIEDGRLPEELGLDEEDMRSILNRVTHLRKTYFSVGPDGQLCALSRGTLEEDYIFIVAGCSVPLVLRSVKHRQRPAFRLIGVAYVQGAMDGEHIIDSAKKVSTGDPDAYDRAFKEILLV